MFIKGLALGVRAAGRFDAGILQVESGRSGGCRSPSLAGGHGEECRDLGTDCPDGATEGEFHPIGARMLEATTWGGTQQSHADLTGYSARPGNRAAGKQANPAKGKAGSAQAGEAITVLATLKPYEATEGNAVLEVDTLAGKAAIRLQDVGFDTPKSYLDGKIVAQRLPAATRFAAAPSDNDYPAAASGRDGAVWVAFVAYRRGGEPDMAAAARGDFRTFVPTGNGDQIRLVKFDGQQWSVPMPVTEPLLDLWKPTVAVGGAGRVWIAWSQQVGGNWDIYRRNYDPAQNQWSPIERVTSDPGSDINVVSATDSTGKVWWAWQGRRGKYFQIFLTSGAAGSRSDRRDGEAGQPLGPGHRRRQQGQCLRGLGQLRERQLRRLHAAIPRRRRRSRSFPIGTLKAFEARPSLAVDRQDRVWIAYEMGGPNWGKDFGRMVPKSAPPADRQCHRVAGRTAGGRRRRGDSALSGPACRGEVLCRRAAPATGGQSGGGDERAAAAQEFRPADDGRRRAALALVPPSSAARRRRGDVGRVCDVATTARHGASRGCWPIRTASWTTGRHWRLSAPTA